MSLNTIDKVSSSLDRYQDDFQNKRLFINEELDQDYNSIMGYLYFGSQTKRIGEWMSMVALQLGLLKVDNDIKADNRIKVAKTIEAFSTNLRQLLKGNLNGNLNGNLKGNHHYAFIISPSFSGFPEPKNFPQHKIAVLVERDGSNLKIGIIDSMPINRQKEISQEKLMAYISEKEDQIWKGYEERFIFNGPELVCRAIINAVKGLDLNCEIFHSQVVRMMGLYGCHIFALFDAINYINDQRFFQNITTGERIFVTDRITIQYITNLPDRFLDGYSESEILARAYDLHEKAYQLMTTDPKYAQELIEENLIKTH